MNGQAIYLTTDSYVIYLSEKGPEEKFHYDQKEQSQNFSAVLITEETAINYIGLKSSVVLLILRKFRPLKLV